MPIPTLSQCEHKWHPSGSNGIAVQQLTACAYNLTIVTYHPGCTTLAMGAGIGTRDAYHYVVSTNAKPVGYRRMAFIVLDW